MDTLPPDIDDQDADDGKTSTSGASDSDESGKGDDSAATHDQEPDELKAGFVNAAIPGAVAIPKNFSGEGIKVAGLSSDDETEEEIAERKRKYRDELDNQLMEQQRQRQQEQEDQSRKTDSDNNSGDYTERMHIKFWRRIGLEVSDKGDYMKMRLGRDKNGKLDQARLEKQVKAIVLNSVLNKGWSKLYFYNERGKIDPTLSGVAEKVITELSQPGKVLYGREVRVSRLRMDDLEPWKWNNSVNRGIRKAEDYLDGHARKISQSTSKLGTAWTLNASFKPKNRGGVDNNASASNPSGDRDKAGVNSNSPRL